MTNPPPSSTRLPLVIGLGNNCRSDDSVGRRVARRLAAEAGTAFQVRESSGEGTSLISKWKASDFVIVVDAIDTGGMPGAIRRMDAHVESIPAEQFFHSSAHTFGLGEAIHLAGAIGRLPRKLIIYTIEGRNFAYGTTISPEVRVAVDTVAQKIRQEFGLPSTAETAKKRCTSAATGCTGGCWKDKKISPCLSARPAALPAPPQPAGLLPAFPPS
ncbi:hypothetical protein BH09VER1_BH09VER1_52160 [soil metagenome]